MKERKWNNRKCSIKTTKDRKREEDKEGIKDNQQKTVKNKIDINLSI